MLIVYKFLSVRRIYRMFTEKERDEFNGGSIDDDIVVNCRLGSNSAE